MFRGIVGLRLVDFRIIVWILFILFSTKWAGCVICFPLFILLFLHPPLPFFPSPSPTSPTYICDSPDSYYMHRTISWETFIARSRHQTVDGRLHSEKQKEQEKTDRQTDKSALPNTARWRRTQSKKKLVVLLRMQISKMLFVGLGKKEGGKEGRNTMGLVYLF